MTLPLVSTHNLGMAKTRGKLLFIDGGYAIVEINTSIIPVELQLEDRLFKLKKEQLDEDYWIYFEKPPYRIDLH